MTGDARMATAVAARITFMLLSSSTSQVVYFDAIATHI